MVSYAISHAILQPGDLRYTVAVPQNHKPSSSLQLILGLHYAGHRGHPFYGGAFLEALLLPAVSDTGAVLLAPDCLERNWLVAQSETNLFRVLNHVEQEYQTARGTTLLVGFSMGGKAAWHLASAYPDRFRAAIPIATLPPDNAAERDWQIPLYVIHSRRDEHFDLSVTETVVAALQNQGVTARLEVLDDLSHYEAARYAPHLKAALAWLDSP